MTEIGRELRQAREETGRTLEEISGVTMISHKHLRALETEDWTAFPGEVYLKGALRKYAGEVGIDPGQAVAWYEATKKSRLIKEQVVQEPVKLLPEKGRDVRVAARRLNKRRLFLVLSFFVLAVFLVRFTYSLLAGRDSVVQPPPPVTAPVYQPPAPEPEVPDKPPAEPDVPAVRIERDPVPGVVAFKVYGTESLLVTLSFSERCWIEVTTDGQRVLAQNFDRGQTYQVQAAHSLHVRIGYPPGLAVLLNGQELQLPAQVRPYTLEIRRQ